MTFASWAICPSCGAIIGDAELHAAWHAGLAATLTPGVQPEPATGPHWPEDLPPVPATPPPPSAHEIAALAHMLAEVQAALESLPQGISALTAYLTLADPTPAEIAAHITILTTVQRDALIAVSDLIRATTWRTTEDTP